jgi:AcrR family transcriptional regulator/DNA-binding MarR family transcriptional regulator
MLSAAALANGRRDGSRVGSVLSRRGDVLVSETQRSRMLSSAVRVISEHGYAEMSVSRITAGAGVSRRTFYDLFEDREDCFLAAFDDALARARQAMLEGCEGQRTWPEQVRGALLGLLLFLDRDPGARALLVLDALKAGPRVQERRVEVLRELSELLHETGSRAKSARELPEITGEGVVGAVLGVIHTRLMAKRPGSMVELLNPLTGVVVLPYLGAAAAQRELSCPPPKLPRTPVSRRAQVGVPGDPLVELPMRITRRTLLVLAVVREHPGASNRQVADAAGVSDQGQISKLLARLEGLGLLANSSPGQPSGEPNQWHLTPRGQQVQHATRSAVIPAKQQGTGKSICR